MFDNEVIRKKDLVDTLIWVADTWAPRYKGREDEAFDDLIDYLLYKTGYRYAGTSYLKQGEVYEPCEEFKNAPPQLKQFETYMML